MVKLHGESWLAIKKVFSHGYYTYILDLFVAQDTTKRSSCTLGRVKGLNWEQPYYSKEEVFETWRPWESTWWSWEQEKNSDPEDATNLLHNLGMCPPILNFNQRKGGEGEWGCSHCLYLIIRKIWICHPAYIGLNRSWELSSISLVKKIKWYDTCETSSMYVIHMKIHKRLHNFYNCC